MARRPSGFSTPGRPSAELRAAGVEPIKVVVRLRPLPPQRQGGSSSGSRSHNGGNDNQRGSVWRVEHGPGQHWVCMQPIPPRRSFGEAGTSGSLSRCSERGARFAFDLCLDASVTNQELFEQAAKKVVQAAGAGSTASILAYGQTSSGKTHSVLGTPREPGILPMAAEEIFGGFSSASGSRRAEGRRGRVSYYEIFNEKVTDLLASSQAPAKLPVKECAERGFYVQGLREAPVRNSQDVLRLVDRGEEKRRYAQTRWNDYSSRSHVIFTLQLEDPVRLPSGEEAESPCSHSCGKLNIVDLAGCENHKHESSDDGRHINRSLFFLGEVISRLCVAGGRRSVQNSPRREARESRSPSRGRDKNSEFIPYRDSKLTRVLRSSLGGDAVTLLLVTVHPAAQFVEQSLTSLRFASKAKCVENHVGMGAEQAPKKVDRTTIDAQQKIIEGLKEKLRLLELERRPSRGSIAAPPAVPQQLRLPIPSSQEQDANRQAVWPNLEVENVVEHLNMYPPDTVKGRVNTLPGETRSPRKASQPQEATAQSWTLQKELHGLRTELAEKEQELATKARLLSERERQVGLLRDQLEMAARSGVPFSDATHKHEAPEVKPSSSASCARPGPPDEGGGLPVIDLDGWAPAGKPLELHNSSGQGERTSQQTEPAPHQAPDPAGISGILVSGGAFSRAEDITCLRSSSSYVARSLNLDLPPPPPLREAPAHDNEGALNAAGHGQTQQELVDKLVQLAIFQISSASKEELPPPSNPDVQGTPRKNHASGRSRDVDLSEEAARPIRGAQ